MYPSQAGPPPPGTPNGAPPAAAAPAPPLPVQQQPPPAPSVPVPPPAEQPQPQTVNPAEAAGKPDEAPAVQNGIAEANGVVPVNGKKRSKTGKNGEPKAKKTKVVPAPTSKGKGEEAPVAAEQLAVNGEDGAAVASDKITA